MGNVDHVLPPGAVCDGCNGYFARKIEGPLLAAPVFREIRFGVQIANKRGRIPVWTVTEGRQKPNYRLMRRFVAKVGPEVLAFKALGVEGWRLLSLLPKTYEDVWREWFSPTLLGHLALSPD